MEPARRSAIRLATQNGERVEEWCDQASNVLATASPDQEEPVNDAESDSWITLAIGNACILVFAAVIFLYVYTCASDW
jgi:hypothetical protein